MAVNSMFGRIARRYDLANRILSGGIDLWWRRRLVASVRRSHPRDVLDLATGSGDVACALGRSITPSVRILGMDFCEPMLDEARLKLAGMGGKIPDVDFRQGDALNLPLPDGSFDAVTIAFGLRNMADRGRCLSEMRRVLRPGGRVFILEFSKPWVWLRPLCRLHLKFVVPGLAALLTGERGAYEYLGNSIEEFPDSEALAEEIRAAGFKNVSVSRMTMGVVALHTAAREEAALS
jgi:demethylmenaquinone methyltransferase/2-methoxy-6-polyprenyl-1,4-benzoquinol methylase